MRHCWQAYGLTGLRVTAGVLCYSAIINALNSLIAIQFLTLCTWLTPNQVPAHSPP